MTEEPSPLDRRRSTRPGARAGSVRLSDGEPAGHQRLRQVGHRQVARTPSRKQRRSEPSPLAVLGRSKPPDLVQHRVERQPPDELHDVEVNALVLADAEDRHDVGVVQPGGGLGLAVEADRGSWGRAADGSAAP